MSALRRGDTSSAVVSAEGDSTLVQVVGRDGEVVASSQALARRGPLVGAGRRSGVVAAPVDLGEVEVRLYVDTSLRGTTVVVASPVADVEEATVRLASELLVGAPLLLGLISSAVWLLTGYALHTVDRLRQQVADLSATGLGRRVDLPAARDEVRHLAQTMNDLLDRIEHAVQAQRRFVADAAHELRGPLAALRARLEVNQRARDPELWQQAAPVLLEDSQRMADLVGDLLALARLDESPQLPAPAAVDLDEIVFAAARRWRGTASVVLDTSRVSAGLVLGDADLLTRVVDNLLSNAVRHAATRVRLSLQCVAGQVELTVADDGAGVPEADRDRVFERFLRLDHARSRDAGGSGLGLAIVRDAVRVHRGSVVLDDARPGVVVTVRIPAPTP